MTRRHGALPRALTIVADAVAAALAFVLAFVLRFEAGLVPVHGQVASLPARYVEALPIAILVGIVAAAWAGTYHRTRVGRASTLRETVRVVLGTGTVLAILALLYWKQFQYSRLFIALGAALFGALWPLGRAIVSNIVLRMRRSGRFRTRFALIGSGEHADHVHEILCAHSGLGLDLALRVALPDESSALDGSALTELVRSIEAGEVDEVYVALPARQGERLPDLLAALMQVTANVRVLPDLGPVALLRPDAMVLDGLALISVRERPLYGLGSVAKRTLDVVLSIVLLLVSAPLLLLLGFLVRATSRGPALYRQERMGLDGRRFGMLKFRTMRQDAESDSGPVFARPGDARVTPVGRWMRRLSLDELPQLWNVLRGEMSLVGPRPERPRFIEEFRNMFPSYMLRHSVRAGMTGWAQVHGLRGDTSLEERLRYDLEYIDRWSVLFDLEILGRTAVQVVVGRNAY